MEYIYTFFLLPMLVIFLFSAIVGAVMFCVDIVKWSKRPEKFTTVAEDLKSSSAPSNSTDETVKEVKEPINIDDIF